MLTVDAGKTGGLCFSADEELYLYPMPLDEQGEIDYDAIASGLEDHKNLKIRAVIIEKVHAMPKQGVASTFTFGKIYGGLVGFFKALKPKYGYEIVLITPQTWTKVMHDGIDKSLKPKDKSRLVLETKYPHVDLRATDRSIKPHEGMMDAFLMAEYWRLKEGEH